MSSSLVVSEEISPGVLRLCLNDPERRNAMSEEMAVLFGNTVEELCARKDLRVVVLTGAGKAFSGGGHLDMLFEKTSISQDENRRLMELFYDQFLSLLRLPVPVVAAINGHAIGAGLCIALACDIRIANEKAKLGVNFVNLALHPGMGATYFLPRIVGPAYAAELLYGGKIIDSNEGHRIGLVNRVVSPEEFDTVVSETVNGIAAAGPQAMRALKESLRFSMTRSLEECLKREAECQALDYSGSEFLEGISAAKEKRKLRF